MFGFGIMELSLIVALLVLLFGAKKIPLIAKGLGEGIRNFKTCCAISIRNFLRVRIARSLAFPC